MSHERSKEAETSSYFAKKFAPATPAFVVGRSYKSQPERDPRADPEPSMYDATLFTTLDVPIQSEACLRPCCAPHLDLTSCLLLGFLILSQSLLPFSDLEPTMCHAILLT